MAKVRTADKSVKIAAFAKDELDLLVETLSTRYPSLKVRDSAVMSALVLAARKVPIEVVKALVETYWEREAAEGTSTASDEL